jgi:predicted metal-binding membrane protein
MLWRYRTVVAGASGGRLEALTVRVGIGYFGAWTLFGAIVFGAGCALSTLVMQWPLLAAIVPVAIGVIVVIAGAFQFSTWKTRHLECCRGSSKRCDTFTSDTRTAWRHGVRLGVHCIHCCFGLTVTLLVIGVMDLHAMAAVTAAISIERLVPGGARAARVVGIVMMAAGAFLLVRAATT